MGDRIGGMTVVSWRRSWQLLVGDVARPSFTDPPFRLSFSSEIFSLVVSWVSALLMMIFILLHWPTIISIHILSIHIKKLCRKNLLMHAWQAGHPEWPTLLAVPDPSIEAVQLTSNSSHNPFTCLLVCTSQGPEEIHRIRKGWHISREWLAFQSIDVPLSVPRITIYNWGSR